MTHTDPFQTLADPSRRRVVEALLSGEQAVNDLVAAVAQRQSGVSRHLRILLEAGFVQVRPDGQRRLYSLRPEPFSALDGWLARYRAHWEARLDRFALALAQRRAPPRPSVPPPAPAPRKPSPTRKPSAPKEQRR